MQLYKLAYICAVLLAGFGSVVTIALYPANEFLLTSLMQTLLAVLTYPLGFVASAISFVLIFTGFMMPAEAIFLVTPIYAVLGYLQWCRLLPAFYRRSR
jgi:hypothetical protein